MEYKNVHIIYFSPTHTSAKTAYAIAEIKLLFDTET